MSQDHGKSAAGETTRLSVVGVERPAGEPMQIGRYRQLFLDDHVIFERANCRREFNQVEKAELQSSQRTDMKKNVRNFLDTTEINEEELPPGCDRKRSRPIKLDFCPF